MNAKHIAVVLQNSYIEGDRRVKREIDALCEAGYEVSLIGVEPPEGVSRWETQSVGLYRFRLPVEGEGTYSYAMEYGYSFWKTYCLLRRVHRHRPVDAIHVCNPPDIFFPLASLYRRKGVKFVFDQHDPAPELYAARFASYRKSVYQALRLMERFTYRTSDAVIVTNESARLAAIARGGVPPLNVHVVRNGPFLTPRRGSALDPGLRSNHAYLACCMGMVAPQDGVDHFIRAAAHLVKTRGRSDICFTVVGGGSALNELKELVRKEGITDHVVFTGMLHDYDLLGRYLSSSDVCVSPEPKNSCNDICTFIKVLDYMAFGRPIVAYDLLETRRSASSAAVYAVPNDPCDLGDKIAGLLDDSEARSRMGKTGRWRVQSALAWEFFKKPFLEAYSRLFETS